MGVKILPDVGDVAENLGVTGILGVVLLPVFLPVIAGVAKPIVKTAVKGGILFYEKSKGAIAEVGESWEDIVAEARAEIGEARMKSAEPVEASAD
ncbi:DUF5132 domain-containing protein [Fischerella sp. PCC 9605]|uniref:DUF5132 domain-containing protein n=1 Tax=Fischerella sp. PCC 9605 TaxID=1173024 RepID=UPI000479DCC0|nr:DUF5132 domain-containing protein [Fischerella sp. PCC 9605]